MRVAFVSNFMNHHQLPLCEAFLDRLGDGSFHFIATTPFDQARLQAGYRDMNREYPWIVRPYDSVQEHRKAELIVSKADVVIAMPECAEYTVPRSEAGKLTFLYSERIFKRGLAWRLLPPKIVRAHKRYVRPLSSASTYLLCSGAYVSYDLSLFGVPEEKCFKWGYFPAVDALAGTSSNVVRHSETKEILWVGRMLKLKRPLHALEGMIPTLLGGGCTLLSLAMGLS